MKKTLSDFQGGARIFQGGGAVKYPGTGPLVKTDLEKKQIQGKILISNPVDAMNCKILWKGLFFLNIN